MDKPHDPADLRDSVPPLSAGSTGRVRALRRPRRAPYVIGAAITAALAIGSLAAKRARSEPPAPTFAPASLTEEPPGALPTPPPEGKPSFGEEDDQEPATVEEQRERLFKRLESDLEVGPEAMSRIKAIFAASPYLSQGNPKISRHPMKRSECRKIRAEAGLGAARVAACGAPNMVPLYDPESGQTARDAPVCIDQFEFPDIPCEYPVVHVRSSEAAEICEAMGKRLCDAHEWEGACAGALRAPEVEYKWGWARLQGSYAHNITREKVWAYGPKKNHALCATNSQRSPDCQGGGWTTCGSNTYPAGAFPECVSLFGVYDQHGNAAEHMSLPIVPEDLASRGGEGFTEMKGSWFVFSIIEAHEDDCRFRAPAWHESRIKSGERHLNYHLGFRCCKDTSRE